MELLNAQLNRKNEQLDAILQTAPDIIFSSQGDGYRDYISDRFFEFTGSNSQVANGHGWIEFIHPEDREETASRWALSTKSGELYEAEYRLRAKLGNTAGLERGRFPFAITMGKLSAGTAHARISTTASFSSNLFGKMRLRSKNLWKSEPKPFASSPADSCACRTKNAAGSPANCTIV